MPAAGPDLVITDVLTQGLAYSATHDGSVDIDRVFTLSTQVSNQGDGPADSTILRHYRDGTEIGTEPVEPLTESGSSWRGSFIVTPPPETGVYSYWACVDEVPGESDTTNNCSDRLQILVQGGPDLVVTSPQVSNPNPQPGDHITFSAIVENQGNAMSASTQFRVYQSDDRTVSIRDTLVGTDNVPRYSAESAFEHMVGVLVPTDPGTYYYGACVDPVADESDTANNCSTGVLVTILGGPDLIVERPGVSDSNPQPGDFVTFSATVTNQGGVRSGSAELLVYQSSDRTINARDTLVGTIRLPGYDPGRPTTESIRIRVPSNPGIYYYGACVRPLSNETDMTNNCSGSATLTVSGQPDLVVTSVWVSDANPSAGARITLYATVANRGNGSSGERTDLVFYRSADRIISTRDTRVDDTRVSVLGPGRDDDESVRLTVPSDAGTYHYGACVDPVVNESNTSNNCSTSVTITVSGRPDLIVRRVTIDETSAAPGATITVTFQIWNQGAADSGRTTATAYRSGDRTIGSGGDFRIDTLNINNIEAGSGVDWLRRIRVPETAGTYYYGACVASVPNESNTRNNCSTGASISVIAQPDLVVSISTTGAGHEFVGAPSSVTATVSNEGRGPAGTSTTIRFYRSTNKRFSSANQFGSRNFRPPSPSRDVDQSFNYTVPNFSDGTTVYYAACVDRVGDESNTTNNCSDWTSRSVYYPLEVINYSCSVGRNIFGIPNSVNIEGLAQARRDVRSATVRWKAIDSFDRELDDRTVQLGRMSKSEFESFSDSTNEWTLFDHCEVTVEWTY